MLLFFLSRHARFARSPLRYGLDKKKPELSLTPVVCGVVGCLGCDFCLEVFVLFCGDLLFCGCGFWVDWCGLVWWLRLLGVECLCGEWLCGGDGLVVDEFGGGVEDVVFWVVDCVGGDEWCGECLCLWGEGFGGVEVCGFGCWVGGVFWVRLWVVR